MKQAAEPYASHAGLVRRLRDKVRATAPGGFPRAEGEPLEAALLSTARYTSEAVFAAEQAKIFAHSPELVAHESELSEKGACLTVDVRGIPLLLVRGDDCVLRAFKNACRHRATQLVSDPAPCRKKAIVCPYHGWTYDLRGSLMHAPHAASFAGNDASRDALVSAHVEARHGLVFAQLTPFSAAAHLGGLDAEMGALGMSTWTAFRRATREVRGNWKLIVDAFLDGYHIRHLHRDSIYRFFIDAAAEAERVGMHIRAVTARRTLRDADEEAITNGDLRALVTPSHVVFPNVVLIFHPDYTSVLRLEPIAADRTRFHHTMLVPELPKSDLERAHWDKSFELIDEGVFAREDLTIVEAMQRGMQSGADAEVLFGDLEKAALWFHASVDDTLAR